MFNREMRTRFSALKPPIWKDKIISKQENAIENYRGKRDVLFRIGDEVLVRDYSDPNKPSWKNATVKKINGPRTYDCTLAHDKRNIKRHSDQMRGIESCTPNMTDDGESEIAVSSVGKNKNKSISAEPVGETTANAASKKNISKTKPIHDALPKRTLRDRKNVNYKI